MDEYVYIYMYIIIMVVDSVVFFSRKPYSDLPAPRIKSLSLLSVDLLVRLWCHQTWQTWKSPIVPWICRGYFLSDRRSYLFMCIFIYIYDIYLLYYII